jgi:hypothetical protein
MAAMGKPHAPRHGGKLAGLLALAARHPPGGATLQLASAIPLPFPGRRLPPASTAATPAAALFRSSRLAPFESARFDRASTGAAGGVRERRSADSGATEDPRERSTPRRQTRPLTRAPTDPIRLTWPKYAKTSDEHLVIREPLSAGSGLAAADRDLWDDLWGVK